MAISEKLQIQDLLTWHPNLKTAVWEKKSDWTPCYNCIAFALGITDQRWTPLPEFGDYWPPGIPQKNTIESWLALFKKYGFQRCANGNYEAGYDKIVIYADKEPNHVAKLVSQGVWHSKMGREMDIHHPLNGVNYGKPMFFLKRKFGIDKPSETARKRALRTTVG